MFHDPPRFPRGFRTASRNCASSHPGKDLAVFVSEVDAAAAAVFLVITSPCARSCSAARRSAAASFERIVVNSKVSNVANATPAGQRAADATAPPRR